MFVVLVTGPPGVGKSVVATALHDGLGDAGIENALVEVDDLERSYPPIGRERAIAHLAALCDSYREAGHTLLLITATLEDETYRRAVLLALGADERLVVRLDAEPSTLKRRLLAREPSSWSGRDELLESAERLAGTMTALEGVDLLLSTETSPPEEVAADIEKVIRVRGHARVDRPVD